MSVFISWSGERSLTIAEALGAWLAKVVQASNPWLSLDIDRGVEWRSRIRDRLRDAKAGIICLTPENLEAPWLLFEAGALSNRAEDEAYVCTYLYQLEPSQVTDPLSHFQHTRANEEETKKLILTINRVINRGLEEAHRPHEGVVESLCEALWPELRETLAGIPPSPTGNAGPQRETKDMVAETLDIVRDLARRLSRAPNSPKEASHIRTLLFDLEHLQRRIDAEGPSAELRADLNHVRRLLMEESHG